MPFRVLDQSAFRLLESDAVRDRILALTRIANDIHPAELVDMFVSETRDEGGRQVVESVWYSSQALVSEFKTPMAELQFDLALLDDVKWIQFEMTEFDLSEESVNEGSRLAIRVQWGGVGGLLGATMRASRTNCIELLRVAKAYLIPGEPFDEGTDSS